LITSNYENIITTDKCYVITLGPPNKLRENPYRKYKLYIVKNHVLHGLLLQENDTCPCYCKQLPRIATDFPK